MQPSTNTQTRRLLVAIALLAASLACQPLQGSVLYEEKPGLPPMEWVPPQDDFDWVQLKSGEWLKGRIKAMQDDKLEFDSEELNDLSLDWKDIRQLRSQRSMTILFEDQTKLSGLVHVTPSQVQIQSGMDTMKIPRKTIQSLTRDGRHEIDYWTGKLTVGMNARAGNTESVDYTAQASLERRTATTRLGLDYLGNLSSTADTETANNHRINASFAVWTSNRLYLVLPFIEYYRDPFQNIDYRLTSGLGVGYTLVKRKKIEWDVSLGPGYQRTYFESVQEGSPALTETGALVVTTKVDWDITKDIEYSFEYRGQLTRKEDGDTTHHTVSTLSFDLTKRLDLDLTLIWDRITRPKVDEEGEQPKPDDYTMSIGLGLDF